MSKAIVYARVSTEEQGRKGFSLGEQLLECRRRAADLGAREIVAFTDEIGGDFLERPGLDQARELLRTEPVQWFICYDPDRFSRKLVNQLLITQEIEACSVQLVFVQHNYERSAEGQLFYALRGAIAEYEKTKILERTARGKRGKLKQGELPGWVDPYGYRMDTVTDHLLVEELEARWVRQIFAWAADPDPAQRLSATRIAHRLNHLGVPAPRGDFWWRSTVHGILHNPLYTGVLYFGKYDHAGVYQARKAGLPAGKRPKATPRPPEQWFRLAVPAIVPAELFERARQYLALDRARRSKGRLYMLTGLAYCGRCGGHLQTKAAGRRYLCCAARYPHGNMRPERRAAQARCDLPHIPAERVEGFVWQTVCRWLTQPAVLAGALAEPAAAANDVEALRQELALVVQQAEENSRAQARVVALVARTHLPPEIAERQLQELTQQADALATRRAELAERLTAGAAATAACAQPNTAALAAELTARLAALSAEQRSNIVRRLVARVVCPDKGDQTWQVVPLGLTRVVW